MATSIGEAVAGLIDSHERALQMVGTGIRAKATSDPEALQTR